MKKILVLISLLFLFIYCITPQNDEIIKIEDTPVYESPPVEVTEVQEEDIKQEKHFSEEAKSYFDEVVVESEFSDSRCVLKWKEDVKIFVKGKKVDYLMVELNKIVSELNDLINPINISVVDNENESNMIIYFGDYITFGNLYPDVNKTNLKNNYGLFRIYYESKSYFDEVVNKSEFSDSRCVLKWKDDVKIFVKGKKVDYLMVELDKIVSELNGLIEPINISVVNNENESNMIIYFGDYITFGNLYPDVTKTNLENNYGYFRIDHKSNNIYFAKLYVDIYRTSKKSCEKHILREELTQSFGLKNDSHKYPESIFYSEWTETTSYAKIDKELIQMLYN